MTENVEWLDFEQVRHTIKNNTVDKLKQILFGFNEECDTYISRSGKKQDIIDRIVSTLDRWRVENMAEKWEKAKNVINEVRNSGFYTPTRLKTNANYNHIIPPTSTTGAFHQYPIPGIANGALYPNVSGYNPLPRYDPYAPPLKPPTVVTPPVTKPLGIRFKESPFYRIDQAISAIVECPESSSSTDRKQTHVCLTINNDQLVKLKSPGSKYQVRLFCTSSVFYSGPNRYGENSTPCLIEFPPTCEVRVNNSQLSANLKGLKKKPGTAPPPDITSYLRLSTISNRVEMVYVNSQLPAQPKKFYIVIMLVETTTVEQLVSELTSNRRRSSEEILQSMVSSSSDDEEIVAGHQKLSLKCPLSFVRIATPCRSSRCVHSQCFDATSWFSVMEQTSTWICPVCERVLDHADLIFDEYFDRILKECSDSVDDVVVEADGEWHTSDNKFSSTGWKSSHLNTLYKQSSPLQIPSAVSPLRPPASGSSKGTPYRDDTGVFVLDSDDDDEGQVKLALSLSLASASSMAGSSFPKSQSVQGDAIIDLTLDSDDEESSPPVQIGKRKATPNETGSASTNNQQWKRSRVEGSDDGHLSSERQKKTSACHLQRDPISRNSDYPPPIAPPTFSPAANGPSAGHPWLPGINAFFPQTNGRWA